MATFHRFARTGLSDGVAFLSTICLGLCIWSWVEIYLNYSNYVAPDGRNAACPIAEELKEWWVGNGVMTSLGFLLGVPTYVIHRQIGENSRRPLKCLADVSRPMRRKLARWGTALAFVINAVTLFIGWFAWGNVLIFQRETEDYIADAVQMSEFEMVDGSNTLVTNGSTAEVIDPRVAYCDTNTDCLPLGESPASLVDNSLATQWVHPGHNHTLHIILNASASVSAYRWATGKSFKKGQRDPMQWRLESSANGTGWVVRDSVELVDSEEVPVTRSTFTPWFNVTCNEGLCDDHDTYRLYITRVGRGYDVCGYLLKIAKVFVYIIYGLHGVIVCSLITPWLAEKVR